MARVLTRNANDPEQVKNARRIEKYRAERAAGDLRAILAMPEGRRVLWMLLERGNLFGSTFVGDPYQNSYRSGMQDFAHFILLKIDEADPSGFDAVRKEAWKDNENIDEPAPRSEDSIDG